MARRSLPTIGDRVVPIADAPPVKRRNAPALLGDYSKSGFVTGVRLGPGDPPEPIVTWHTAEDGELEGPAREVRVMPFEKCPKCLKPIYEDSGKEGIKQATGQVLTTGASGGFVQVFFRTVSILFHEACFKGDQDFYDAAQEYDRRHPLGVDGRAMK